MSRIERLIAAVVVTLLVVGVVVTETRSRATDTRAVAARQAELGALTRVESQLRATGASNSQLKAARAQIAALRAAASSSSSDAGALDAVAVIGNGKVTTTPDMIVASLAVNVTKPTARDAMARANAQTRRLLAALRDAGVEKRDIQTQWVSLYENRYKGTRRFVAANRVTAKFRGLSDAGEKVQRALDAVGNNAELGGISFGMQEPEVLQRRARDASITDAHERAAAYARAAGRTLGRVLSISESTPGEPQYAYGSGNGLSMSADLAPSIPFAAGESDTTSQVLVVYALQ